MTCYITATGSFLPGNKVENEEIDQYLGTVPGEDFVKGMVLQMNQIKGRHYALDKKQHPTYDVYDLASQAIQDCLKKRTSPQSPVSLISAGTTCAPLSGPGIGSILHDRLKQLGVVNHPIEIGSHSGICSSAAGALVSAIRSVQAREHDSALAVGSEVPSCLLKSTAFQVVDDRDKFNNIRQSQWFMSAFLRFMLSDGAGTFLVEGEPKPDGVSFEVNWTFSRSYAHKTPLCMKMVTRELVLTQDINILSKFIAPTTDQFFGEALSRYGEDLDQYRLILPHLSSFFFLKYMQRLLKGHTRSGSDVPIWTNLADVGNIGAASIFIMLDHFLRDHEINDGDRILLFIPESGQFNFVMVSLTAVVR